MFAPSSFTRQLQREFDGRYRLRWSKKRQEWHLEQKVGVGAADLPFRLDEEDDSLVRAKDGYFFVMAIRPGDRGPCPGVDYSTNPPTPCGATLKVPIKETAEVKCERCELAGRDPYFPLAYFPLDDTLIQHIRHIDFALGHNEHIARMQDNVNEMLMATNKKDALNEIDDVSYDVRKLIAGIEQVGYGGSIIRRVGNTSY